LVLQVAQPLVGLPLKKFSMKDSLIPVGLIELLELGELRQHSATLSFRDWTSFQFLRLHLRSESDLLAYCVIAV